MRLAGLTINLLPLSIVYDKKSHDIERLGHIDIVT